MAEIRCACPSLGEVDVYLCYSCRLPKRLTWVFEIENGAHLHVCGDCAISVVPMPAYAITQALARGRGRACLDS